MPSAKIDNLTFSLWDGVIDLPGEAVELLMRRGRDHHFRLKTGERAAESPITTTEFVASASLAGRIAAYKLLQGESVTVYDDRGATITNCTILTVEILQQRAVLYAGETKIRLSARWTIQAGAQV